MKSRRHDRTPHASKTFGYVLRCTLVPWLRFMYHQRGVNRELFRTVRPPFLLLANHSSVWDPFLVNGLFPYPVHYVVTDASFRSRLVGFGLSLVGSIRKTKAMSDMDSMKNIMRVKDRGGVIGIFPEGQSTWDGHSLPIVPSTAKLAKLLRIPVVTARVAGAYFSRPRWAKKSRHGRVLVHFELALTPEELKTKSPEEIKQKIEAGLKHDDTEFNRAARVPFYGRDRAEYLERALFVCPACTSISSLHSEGSSLGCNTCGYEVRFGLFGTFTALNGDVRFDSIHDWNVWQMKEYERQLSDYLRGPNVKPFIVDSDVDVQIGYRSRPLAPFASGTLELHGEAIVLLTETEKRETFPVWEIRGANVQNNEHWEFYVGQDLYRVTIRDPRGCTYKWDLAVRLMNGSLKNLSVE